MENKRKMLIESLKILILKKGYSNTTIDDITKEANISKGSFYTYFKNKDELLEEILSNKMESIKKENEKILKEDFTLDAVIENFLISKIKERGFDIKTEVVVMNILQNLDVLSPTTKKFLLERDQINIKFFQDIFIKYSKFIKIELKDVINHAKIIDCIINHFKINKFYVTIDVNEGFSFENNIDAIKEKMNSSETDSSIEFLKKIILKILT
ncbi:MAG: TetR/AcrR family transcriptional regulator [Fusobacteriaceae bacterium]|jgi:AcrR family transcriptional regulator|nr:TetR/AcrR family transcriptional regulator [Fusobacteriaceae bacterium]